MAAQHRRIRCRRPTIQSGTIDLLLLSCILLTAAALGGEEAADAPELEILARYTVPEMDDRIMAVQWASKNSIYLGLFDGGVIEVELREGLPEIAHLVGTRPDLPNVKLKAIDRFAVSDDWIVASHHHFAWARRSSGGGPLASSVRQTKSTPFDWVLDGDQIVMWGLPDLAHWEEEKGGLLWTADLSKGLDTWRVLYENDEVAAAGDWLLLRENLAAPGSIVILDGGDIVLAPNTPRILPTVLRFSSTGKLKETWTAEEIWNDDKGEVLDHDGEEEIWAKGNLAGKDYGKFLSKRRIVDDVLGLPDGPAIVVREPEGGEARWRLAVLTPEVHWYDIPARTVSSAAQVRGDVDKAGRIVLVGAARELHKEVKVTENEVLVMRLPLP